MKTKTITVNVTKKFIIIGEFISFDSCPIALALAVTGLKFKGVSDEHVRLRYEAERQGIDIVRLPRKAQAFIRAFDGGTDRKKLKAFKFKLKVPMENLS